MTLVPTPLCKSKEARDVADSEPILLDLENDNPIGNSRLGRQWPG